MTSVFKLRVVNAIGSLIFMCYALIIHSYPTALMNFCLVIINLHFLWKIRTTGKHYDAVLLNRDDGYLAFLLKRQQDDINKFFPDVDIHMSEANRIYLITCQGVPAGIVVGCEEDDQIKIFLDYSFPEYRDFSVGGFLLEELRKEGVHKVTYVGPTEHHMDYLNKLGYKNIDGRYVREL